jgi:hypothetical protein
MINGWLVLRFKKKWLASTSLMRGDDGFQDAYQLVMD